MADQRIKGQEVEILVLKDGQIQQFTDIQSFEMTQETETKEEEYLGEKANRYDEIYKGYSFSIGMHNSSPQLFPFLAAIKDRAQRRTPGTTINIKATLNFPSGLRSRVILNDAFFDAAGINFGSRSDYGTTTLPGKGSDFRVL